MVLNRCSLRCLVRTNSGLNPPLQLLCFANRGVVHFACFVPCCHFSNDERHQRNLGRNNEVRVFAGNDAFRMLFQEREDYIVIEVSYISDAQVKLSRRQIPVEDNSRQCGFRYSPLTGRNEGTDVNSRSEFCQKNYICFAQATA